MYQVKKSKSRSTPLRSALHKEPVYPSIPGSFPTDPDQQFLDASFRVLDRYALQDDLVATLRRTEKHAHLVARVAECHRSFRHKVCGHNHQWAEATKSCNCRLCPHDQRKRSLRLAHRWSDHLVGRQGLRYCVLSERNSADLSEGIKSLYRAWKRLRASALWKGSCVGSIAVLEVTYNREEETWHPHLNVLFEGDYIPFEALRQEWEEATDGEGQTAFIRQADAGTVRELLKYVTKLSDFVEQPDAVDEFLSATARRRFIRTYATFYRMPVDEEEGTERCPDCNDDCVADVGIVHASQIVIDYKGILRVDRNLLRPSQSPESDDFFIAWPRAPVNRDRYLEPWKKQMSSLAASQEWNTWSDPLTTTTTTMS